jgi:hypothetical protein
LWQFFESCQKVAKLQNKKYGCLKGWKVAKSAINCQIWQHLE